MRARLPDSSPSCRVGSKKRISGSASSPDRSEENDRPHLVSWPFGGQGGKQTGDCRWDERLRHGIITTQNHPPQNHHTTRKENDVPAKHRPTASSVVTAAQNPAEPNRWTPHTSQRGSPPSVPRPPANQLPQTHHTQKRWQRHTLLQTGYHSSSRHRHSLPVLKLVSSRKMKKDKTALPSPISKLPATRPALSKPPSWVLLRKLSQKRKPHYPRYHLSSTSSCREMENSLSPVRSSPLPHCHLPNHPIHYLPL